MPAVILNEGLPNLWGALLANGGYPYMAVRLFTNNYTPLATSTLSNFTACTDSAYTESSLNPLYWSQISIISGVVLVNYVPILYIFAGGTGETVYGAVMFDLGSGVGYWAQKFTVGVPINTAGSSITVPPSVQLGAI